MAMQSRSASQSCVGGLRLDGEAEQRPRIVAVLLLVGDKEATHGNHLCASDNKQHQRLHGRPVHHQWVHSLGRRPTSSLATSMMRLTVHRHVQHTLDRLQKTHHLHNIAFMQSAMLIRVKKNLCASGCSRRKKNRDGVDFKKLVADRSVVCSARILPKRSVRRRGSAKPPLDRAFLGCQQYNHVFKSLTRPCKRWHLAGAKRKNR